MEATLAFLKLNNTNLIDKLIQIENDNKIIPATGGASNEILINFTLETASGLLSLHDCKIWFKHNISIEADLVEITEPQLF